MSRTWVSSLMAAAVLFPLASTAQGAIRMATYSFGNTLAADEPGAPSLTAVDPLGPFDSTGDGNRFVRADVFGEIRLVYQWGGKSDPAEQAGLTLDTSGLISPDDYSIEIVVKFAPTDGLDKYRRILDVQDRSSDNGFYVKSGEHRLAVFETPPPVIHSGQRDFTFNEFHHVVLTVSKSNQVRAYLDGATLNGSLGSDLNATTSVMNIDNPDRLLHFFLDNEMSGGQGEVSDIGQIASLRTYEGPLTPQEVDDLYNNSPLSPQQVVPEPASVAVWGFGLATWFAFVWLSPTGMRAARRRSTRRLALCGGADR